MCDFCEGKEMIQSRYCDISIQFAPVYGKSLAVSNTEKRCPRYAECSAKGMNIVSNFEIYYCPICGRKIDKK